MMKAIALLLLVVLSSFAVAAPTRPQSVIAIPYETLYFYYVYKLEHAALSPELRKIASELTNRLGRMATFSEFINYITGNAPVGANEVHNPKELSEADKAKLREESQALKAAGLSKEEIKKRRAAARKAAGKPAVGPADPAGAASSSSSAPAKDAFNIHDAKLNTMEPKVDANSKNYYDNAHGKERVAYPRVHSDVPTPAPDMSIADEKARSAKLEEARQSAWMEIHTNMRKSLVSAAGSLEARSWPGSSDTDRRQAIKSLQAIIETRTYDTEGRALTNTVKEEILKLPFVPPNLFAGGGIPKTPYPLPVTQQAMEVVDMEEVVRLLASKVPLTDAQRTQVLNLKLKHADSAASLTHHELINHIKGESDQVEAACKPR